MAHVDMSMRLWVSTARAYSILGIPWDGIASFRTDMMDEQGGHRSWVGCVLFLVCLGICRPSYTHL